MPSSATSSRRSTSAASTRATRSSSSASSSSRVDAPPRERLAVAAGDEPEQDPARDRLLVVAERPERRLGVPADGAADAARPLVGGERQRPAVALAPEVEQRRREERQAAGLAGDVVDERVDERRLDLEPGPLGRPLDRAAELAGAHRPEQDVVRADEVGELDVRREAAEEVGAQRDQDRARAAPDPRPRRRARRRTHAARPRRPTARTAPRTGRRRARAARPAARARGADELGRRPLAGADEQRTRRPSAGSRPARSSDDLPLPDGPTIASSGASASRATSSSTSRSRPKKNSASSASNGASPLNGQTSRSGAARSARAVDGDVQRRVLDEDRPLELLQLDARLEPELVVQERPRPPVDLEPFGLPAAAVEREHQLRAEALAVGVLGDERLELGDERELAAERELGVDPLLDRRQPQLLEPLDLDPRERLELEVGERPSVPQSARPRAATAAAAAASPAASASRPSATSRSKRSRSSSPGSTRSR